MEAGEEMMTNAVHPTPEDGAEALKITIKEQRRRFRARGMDGDFIARKIKKGTNAKKQHTHFEKGTWYYSKSMPDNQIQYKWMEMLVKIEELFPSEKLDLEEGVEIILRKKIKVVD